ncbi:MAG: hypothetical protein IJJ69_04415 [Oscillospiraceae bacterium]|nr:hypothetical protein [Oscillospiraceae bacterium]
MTGGKTHCNRVIAVLLTIVFMINLFDGRVMSELWRQLKTFAAASDYSVGFYWDTSGLGESDATARSYALSNDNTTLELTEFINENPVLKTTFFFNLARTIEPEHMEFTITGLNKLIRDGTLSLNMKDPNLVGTWEITKDEANDVYTFKNKVKVTSNNETTFTWQFNSREAMNGADITLETSVKVTEIITTYQTNPDTGEQIAIQTDQPAITLESNPINFKYHSEHDANEVKIVCKDINDTDFNNLNGDYDWRSYYSMLGLEGFTEYNKKISDGGTEYVGTNQEYEAHVIEQDYNTQLTSQRSRGINTSDYFIEVELLGGLETEDVMVVNSAGNYIPFQEITLPNGRKVQGFYDFRGKKDILPGQSYSSEYRVGIKNDAIKDSEKGVKLTGHYLVKYNDEQTVQDYTDTAAHVVSQDDEQPVGNGGYLYKYNEYEINQSKQYNGHWYDSHARHYNGVYQLLYDNIFNGKVVTYNLNGRTPRIETTVENDKVQAVNYDLVYQDGAPYIKNLLSNPEDRELGYDAYNLTERELDCDEYDFQKIVVKKLVDGDTVTSDTSTTSGFYFDIYVKSNDAESSFHDTWTKIDTSGSVLSGDAHTGNTVNDTDVYLPAGIDEIQLVVRNLDIRADVGAYVDIAYNIHDDDYDKIYIDTEHLYEDNNSQTVRVTENTNKGTKLVNSFERKQFVGVYDANQSYEVAEGVDYETGKIVESTNNTVHSNTWLRDSVTTIEASADIEEFLYHEVTGVGESNYYSTNITAGGTIQSDTQKALQHFVVYSEVPNNVNLSDEWMTQLMNSMTFSGTLLGGAGTVDKDFVLKNSVVSIYYDESLQCVVADFDFNGFALDSSAQTSVQFQYPAEITLMQFNALEKSTEWFKTNAFVTVLDDNVRLSAVKGSHKTLLSPSDEKNPTKDTTKKEVSMDTAQVTISALGSQKSNYTSKYVSSYYTKWIYDNSAEVDGNNAEHFDNTTGRMTSEYSYKLIFNRFSNDTSEKVIDPIVLDIVDGLQDSAWHGYVKNVTFDTNSYPSEYTPSVYYLLRGSLTPSDGRYKYADEVVDNAISDFSVYGKNAASTTTGVNYDVDLAIYENLKSNITATWVEANKDSDGSFIINQENVYAIAIIYKGEHIIGDEKEVQLTAYVNMRAPALTNDGEEINNNRATYNDTHVFAQGHNGSNNVDFPMYSVSDVTMVIMRHNIELMKVSSANNDKRLSGATFSVYNGNSVSGTNVDDEQNIVSYYEKGKSQISYMKDAAVNLSGVLQMNLAPGIYYYKETKAPTGYELNDTLFRFRAIADENAVFYYTAELKTEEQLNSEYLIVNKKEYDTYAQTIYRDKEAVDTDKIFHIYTNDNEEVGYMVYDAQNNQYAYNTQNGTPADVDVKCICGSSPRYVTIASLPAGSYFIGSALDDKDKYSFSVADNSSVSFMILKKSPLSSEMVYQLKEMGGTEPAANDALCTFTKNTDGTYVLNNSSGNVTEIIPEADGKIKISGLDSNKTYYFENTAVPQGYKRAAKQIISKTSELAFYVTEQLEKTDKLLVEDDPIETVQAKFQKIDGTKYAEEGNPIEPLNNAVYQMYFIEDDGTESLLYFQFNSATHIYTLKGKAGSKDYISKLTSVPFTEKDGEQNTITKDGIIAVDMLGYGTYILEEVTAPLGYQLNTKRQYFYVTPAYIDENKNLKFSDGENMTSTLLLKDEEVLSQIVLEKADSANTEHYLDNAAYNVYRLQKNTDSSVSEEEYLQAAQDASTSSRGITSGNADFTKYWGEEPIKQIFTDANGSAKLDNLSFGTYLLYEDVPSVGYQWNNDIGKWETYSYIDGINETDELHSQIIEISQKTVTSNCTPTNVAVNDASGNTPDSDEWTPTYETVPVYHAFYAKHIDERKDGKARLVKRNENRVGLTDAVFALYQVNLTDEEIAGILGKTKEEVTAMPESDKKKELNKKELQVSDIVISNHFDIANGTPKTKDSTAITIDKAVNQNLQTNGDASEKGATITSEGLEWGIYYYYEVKAPAGYQADKTPHFFAVNSASVDTLIEIEVTDAKTYGKIWLYKQAKEATDTGHTKLFGAQFNLYTSENEKVKAVPMLRLSDKPSADGKATQTKNLLVSGFSVENKKIRFTLKDGGSVTVEYDENDAGTLASISAEGGTYGFTPTIYDFRLTYYAVSLDQTKYYDDNKKMYIPIKPELSDDATEEQKTNALAEEQKIRDCITDTYVTADEGGQLCVRGLEWKSYYFREIVPPEGYGLADDVTFTVNAYNCDNQFLKCEDPPAKAAIIIDKELPNAEYFKAYGEPTFMFRIYELSETENGQIAYTLNAGQDTQKNYYKTGTEYTLAIPLSESNITESGTVNSSAMISVNEGQYLIEELPVSRYKCDGLEIIGNADDTNAVFNTASVETPTSYKIFSNSEKYHLDTNNPWQAFCDLTGAGNIGENVKEILAFHIKYKNKIERYDNFSHVSYADNRIPESEYVTAFKPIYKPLVPVYSGADTSHTYEIDLKTAFESQDKDFEAVLSYNTGATKSLTSLENISFKSSVDNVSGITVSYDNNTGKLSLQVTDPSALAGQTISLDVGYGSDVYNENNTNMVKGTLNLTFSEIQASLVKKLVLKNDVANKSYFSEMVKVKDPETGEETIIPTKSSSVAVLYTQSADKSQISKTMQNTAQSDTLLVLGLYKLAYWYLLNSDGKPVLDSKGQVVAFNEKSEIETFIFDGTYPQKYENDITLVSEEMKEIKNKIENINVFTFQAELEEETLTARIILDTKDALNEKGILGISNAGHVSGKITGLSKTTMTAFKAGNEKGWNSCDDDHRLTYDSYAGNYTPGDPYPDYVRFYNIGTEVYWYTVNRETLKPTNGSVYLEQTANTYSDTPNLFKEYTNLNDVSGMFDWDFSGMNMCGYMFQKTAITTFELNRTIKKSGYMYLSRMFYECSSLISVTMNIDTSEAVFQDTYTDTGKTYISAQTKQMFYGCSSLSELNLSGDFTNIYNVENMFQGCTSLTATEFKDAFADWVWNTDTVPIMQNREIFKNYSNAASLQGMDLVDANGNHFKQDGNIITFVRLAD